MRMKECMSTWIKGIWESASPSACECAHCAWKGKHMQVFAQKYETKVNIALKS